MKIKTEFNLKDIVFWLNDARICKGKIGRVSVFVLQGSQSEHYDISTTGFNSIAVPLKSIFRTKEDLIQSLSKQRVSG